MSGCHIYVCTCVYTVYCINKGSHALTFCTIFHAYYCEYFITLSYMCYVIFHDVVCAIFYYAFLYYIILHWHHEVYPWYLKVFLPQRSQRSAPRCFHCTIPQAVVARRYGQYKIPILNGCESWSSLCSQHFFKHPSGSFSTSDRCRRVPVRASLCCLILPSGMVPVINSPAHGYSDHKKEWINMVCQKSLAAMRLLNSTFQVRVGRSEFNLPKWKWKEAI